MNLIPAFLFLAFCLPFGAAFLAPASLVARSRMTTTVSSPTSIAPPPMPLAASTTGIELANLLYDSTDTAFSAWEWCNGLSAPAALVAGAVLVSLSETRADFAPRKSDSRWIRHAKQACRFLLLSSFGLEVVAVFVNTVTGTVLLSHGDVGRGKAVGYTSPLALLYHHHEFEYLTITIGFLQGLIHWLVAIALENLIPKPEEGATARRMNSFLASCLATITVFILAFSNHHFSFHGNYGGMLKRYAVVLYQQFFGEFRPMSLLYGPGVIVSAVLGWRAFFVSPNLDDDDKD